MTGMFVTFILILRSTEYGTCAGSVLSVLDSEGSCSSYPSGPAAAILVSLDHDLFTRIIRAAAKCVICSNSLGPQETITDLPRHFPPTVTSSYNATAADVDVSIVIFSSPLDSSSHISYEIPNAHNHSLSLVFSCRPLTVSCLLVQSSASQYGH